MASITSATTVHQNSFWSTARVNLGNHSVQVGALTIVALATATAAIAVGAFGFLAANAAYIAAFASISFLSLVKMLAVLKAEVPATVVATKTLAQKAKDFAIEKWHVVQDFASDHPGAMKVAAGVATLGAMALVYSMIPKTVEVPVDNAAWYQKAWNATYDFGANALSWTWSWMPGMPEQTKTAIAVESGVGLAALYAFGSYKTAAGTNVDAQADKMTRMQKFFHPFTSNQDGTTFAKGWGFKA